MLALKNLCRTTRDHFGNLTQNVKFDLYQKRTVFGNAYVVHIFHAPRTATNFAVYGKLETKNYVRIIENFILFLATCAKLL